MAQGGEPTPGAAPALTPQANRGEQASALADVMMGLRLIQSAVSKFPFESKEAKAMMKILSTGASAFGRAEDNANAILPAEIGARLQSSAAGAGPPPAPPAASAGSLPPGASRGMPGAGPAPP
jgi:hypothetical protein